jgi:hypothetical protein
MCGLCQAAVLIRDCQVHYSWPYRLRRHHADDRSLANEDAALDGQLHRASSFLHGERIPWLPQ